MSDLNKEEWLEWCEHPITKEFLVHVNNEMNQAMWDLAENAGEFSFKDARNSGKVMALGKLVDWRPESIMEDVNLEPASQEDVDKFLGGDDD